MEDIWSHCVAFARQLSVHLSHELMWISRDIDRIAKYEHNVSTSEDSSSDARILLLLAAFIFYGTHIFCSYLNGRFYRIKHTSHAYALHL